MLAGVTLFALGVLTPAELSTLAGLSVRLSSTFEKMREKSCSVERAKQDGSCHPDDSVTHLQVDGLAVRLANPLPGHVALHFTMLALCMTPSFNQCLAWHELTLGWIAHKCDV